MNHRLNELATLAAAGGDREFEELLTACRPLIISNVTRITIRSAMIDSDDLIQVASLAVHEALKKWKPNRASFSTYAGRVVRCRLLSLIKHSVPTTDSFTVEPQDLSQSFEVSAEMRDEAAVILEGTETRDRTIIEGIAAGNSYRDMGEIFDITAAQVDNVIQKFRRGSRSIRRMNSLATRINNVTT